MAPVPILDGGGLDWGASTGGGGGAGRGQDDLIQDVEGFANYLDVRAKEQEIRMAPGFCFCF